MAQANEAFCVGGIHQHCFNQGLIRSFERLAHRIICFLYAVLYNRDITFITIFVMHELPMDNRELQDKRVEQTGREQADTEAGSQFYDEISEAEQEEIRSYYEHEGKTEFAKLHPRSVAVACRVLYQQAAEFLSLRNQEIEKTRYDPHYDDWGNTRAFALEALNREKVARFLKALLPKEMQEYFIAKVEAELEERKESGNLE
jgi:hypothetical protein